MERHGIRLPSSVPLVDFSVLEWMSRFLLENTDSNSIESVPSAEAISISVLASSFNPSNPIYSRWFGSVNWQFVSTIYSSSDGFKHLYIESIQNLFSMAICFVSIVVACMHTIHMKLNLFNYLADF